MNEGLDGMTLANWVSGVWYKHRRGVPLIGHEAAIVYCMENHPEWRARWDALGNAAGDPETSRDVLHVHFDAMVKMQIDTNSPPEIKECYDKLREKQFTEFEALHTLTPALSEVMWLAKTKNEPFDQARYVRLAQDYMTVALLRPTFRRRQER